MHAAAGQHIQLVEEPSTLLLPVNQIGSFTCKGRCDHECSAYWVINSSDLLQNTSRMHQHFHGDTSRVHTLTLNINASDTFNNTEIRCRYEPNGDRPGIVLSDPPSFLFIISGMKMMMNESVITLNLAQSNQYHQTPLLKEMPHTFH